MKTRTLTALIAACLALGLSSCADFYKHGYVGGDAGARSADHLRPVGPR